jgi:hypothetical protein
MHPSISPDGLYIAYSAGGNIRVSPLNGVVSFPMTIDKDMTDAHPDWSSPTEIIFQRKKNGTDKREIWCVQVQDLP